MARRYVKKYDIPHEMYNPELKQRFIDTYDIENTRINITRKFYMTNFKKEKELNKDLCDFTNEECQDLLYSFNSKSASSLASIVSILRNYINFTINIGRRENAINFFDMLKLEDLDKYVAKNVYQYMYITRDELYSSVISQIFNPQDAVIYALLFEGVKGKELLELRNLKPEDIDFNNKTITIQPYIIKNSNGTTKEVPMRIIENVDDRTLEIIEGAIHQSIYYRGNSEDNRMGNSLPNELDLEPTSYILKNTITSKNPDMDAIEDKPITKQTVQNRMNKVKKYLENPELVNMLNPTNLVYAGMLDDLIKIADKKGTVDFNDFSDVVVSRGMQRNSYYRLKNIWEILYVDTDDEIEESDED